jgi:hypothetical protein
MHVRRVGPMAGGKDRKLWGILWGLRVRKCYSRLLPALDLTIYFQSLKQGYSMVSNPA